jgi:hypothetical protein
MQKHNYLQAQKKKKTFPHTIPNRAIEKRCEQGYSAFDTK